MLKLLKKKGQNSIPAILLISLLLFLIYIVWLNPGDRNELLFTPEQLRAPNATNNIVNNTTVNSVTGYFFEENGGYVGRSTGKLIQSTFFDDFVLDYKEVKKSLLKNKTTLLNSNILSNDDYEFNVEGDFKSLELSFKINEVIGSPKISIESGGEIFLETPIKTNQTVSYSLSKNLLIDNTIRIICKFNSFNIFSTQSCGLENIDVNSLSFEKKRNSKSFDFNLNSLAKSLGDEFKIIFSVTDSEIKAPLKIVVNDISLKSEGDYYAKRTASYSETNNVLGLNLAEGFNLITFSTTEGGYYNVKKLKILIYEKSSGETEKVFSFQIDNVSKINKNTNKFHTLTFEVNKIIEKGNLNLKVNGKDFHVSQNNVFEGKNFLRISGKNLFEGGNILTISSTSGRFELGDVKLKI